MSPSTQRKLDEVCAGYGDGLVKAHRCGLFECQDRVECIYPGISSAGSSDLSSDGRIQNIDEMLWRDEGREAGWIAPLRRRWPYRLPVIRHVYALVLSWRVHSYAGEWASLGVGVGGPNPYDLWCVEGAWHGYW